MDINHIQILLSIVKKNGDVRRLKREGLNYIQIAELTNYAIVHNLVVYSDNTTMLSEKGEAELMELTKNLKRIKKENWIDKEVKSKIEKLDKNFIFLPNQNELDF